MKILQISTTDISGGAAIAGYRLYQSLQKLGVDVKILVGQKQTNDLNINQINQRPYINKALTKISARVGLHYLAITDTWNIKQHPFYQEADILNFHNLHGQYFNYLAMPQLTDQRPAVYTLHDMWSFTGHCAYSFACDRWQIGCGQCPNLATYPAVKVDNTRIEWQLKKWIYQSSDLTIVTPSHWLKEAVQKSILKDKPIYHIPYGLDLAEYQPLDQKLCRLALNLDINKHIIALGAQNLGDYRKGTDLVLAALQKLPESLKQNLILLLLGNQSQEFAQKIDIPVISLGYVEGDRLKAIFYSAADIFVCPTRADNLPLVLQESMACGTPMVSFDVGGVTELVRDGVTGYVALPENAQDLSQKIIQILENHDIRAQMSENCRQIALQEYSLELQAKRYLELYQHLLQR